MEFIAAVIWFLMAVIALFGNSKDSNMAFWSFLIISQVWASAALGG